MATSPSITRRQAFATLGAATASSVALAIPAVAAVNPVEHPNDKVRRLSREIAEALRDEQFLGFKRVSITPDGVTYDEPESEWPVEARFDYHLARSREAMDELAGEGCGWVIMDGKCHNGKRPFVRARTWEEDETIVGNNGKARTIRVGRQQPF